MLQHLALDLETREKALKESSLKDTRWFALTVGDAYPRGLNGQAGAPLGRNPSAKTTTEAYARDWDSASMPAPSEPRFARWKADSAHFLLLSLAR